MSTVRSDLSPPDSPDIGVLDIVRRAGRFQSVKNVLNQHNDPTHPRYVHS